MDLLGKVQQKKVNPIREIAQKAGVTEAYVRMVLKGTRNGAKHTTGKGKLIRELAEQVVRTPKNASPEI